MVKEVQAFSHGISLFILPQTVLIIAFAKPVKFMEDSRTQVHDAEIHDEDFRSLYVQSSTSTLPMAATTRKGGEDDPDDPDYAPPENVEQESRRETSALE
jgi:hypothetical protein